MYYNVRLTGVQQDDSEDGHSKEKNDSGKNSTECNHSWEEVSTFWRRPCGARFKINQHQSTWPKYEKVGYDKIKPVQ